MSDCDNRSTGAEKERPWCTMHWFLKPPPGIDTCHFHPHCFTKAMRMATTNTKRSGKYNPTRHLIGRNISMDTLVMYHYYINSVVMGHETWEFRKTDLNILEEEFQNSDFGVIQ